MNVPIRIRLALATCTVFLGLTILIETCTYLCVRTAINSLADTELQRRYDGLVDYLNRHASVYSGRQLNAALAVHPAFEPKGLFIRKHGGTIVFTGAWMTSFNGNGFPFSTRFRSVERQDMPLRVLYVTRTLATGPYDIAVAVDLTVAAGILHRLWLAMLLSGPAMLLLAGASGYWISGRALYPVSEIITAARSIDSTRLQSRLVVPPVRDEIRCLAETINDMLERIDHGVQRIRAFTAEASHELRTPLSIIRAAAEIALLRPADAKTDRQALQRILRESERNSQMLEQLLSLARMDAGSDVGLREPVDLATSLKQACTQVSQLAAEKDIALQVSPTHESIYVNGDASQLHRLWLILLDNALKYTSARGSVHIAARTHENTCDCHIRDTGIGITPEDLPRIFDRFYRVDKARTRSEGGCGLGLAIAAEIVRLHSGSITVDSEPGVGSCFIVRLPLMTQPAPPGTISASLQNLSYRP